VAAGFDPLRNGNAVSDQEYADDCIKFLRELAERIRTLSGDNIIDDADKLDEIATSIQLAILENAQ